jgi:hypothetical protein
VHRIYQSQPHLGHISATAHLPSNHQGRSMGT